MFKAHEQLQLHFNKVGSLTHSSRCNDTAGDIAHLQMQAHRHAYILYNPVAAQCGVNNKRLWLMKSQQTSYRFQTVVPVFKIQGVSQVTGASIGDARLAGVFVDALLTALIKMLCTLVNIHAVLAVICQSESTPAAKVHFIVRHVLSAQLLQQGQDNTCLFQKSAGLSTTVQRQAFKIAGVFSLLTTHNCCC